VARSQNSFFSTPDIRNMNVVDERFFEIIRMPDGKARFRSILNPGDYTTLNYIILYYIIFYSTLVTILHYIISYYITPNPGNYMAIIVYNYIICTPLTY